MRAPYIPTLGPVPPADVSPELMEAVLDVAHTDRFLPYDKDRRRSATKDEQVLVDAIVPTTELTLIPTLTTRGGGLVKLHHSPGQNRTSSSRPGSATASRRHTPR